MVVVEVRALSEVKVTLVVGVVELAAQALPDLGNHLSFLAATQQFKVQHTEIVWEDVVEAVE